MPFYADLHIHSKYSRATSRDCDLEHLAWWARRKGITVVATGDFTHPVWFDELRDKLVPAEPGLFRLRPEIEREVERLLPASCAGPTRFLLEVEISTIYKKGERTRKVHHLVYAASFETAGRFRERLGKIGNLASDGRPILGLDSRHLLEITLESGPDAYLVPAHVWTPWFSVLGSKSGFDAVEECYEDLSPHIFAVETGLSSDPPMNWRVSGLDRYTLVSNSDAHSPPMLGREACRFDTDLDYFALREALETGRGWGGTVEFFPEEGKYHLDGHRSCGVRLDPEETRRRGGLCPACGKALTVGVMHRVEALADRPEGGRPDAVAPYRCLVPLPEIVAEIHRVGARSKTVERSVGDLVTRLGPELGILEDLPPEDLRRAGDPLLAEALERLRRGQVRREAGFDGEYGVIRLFEPGELEARAVVAPLFELPPEPARPEAAAPGPAAESTAGGVPDAVSQGSGGGTEAERRPEDGKESARQGALFAAAPSVLDGLDPEQREAAEVVDGALLIVAGPGTGKTRTLTHRLAHLVGERGVAPERCLALTFTRRAAEEMRQRLAALAPGAAERLTVTTFHGLGLRLLRELRSEVGLPRGFRVADPAQCEALATQIFGLQPREARRKLAELSTARSGIPRADPEDAPREASGDLRVWEEALCDRGWVDFDGLLLLPLRLLGERPDLAAAVRERFGWVSIDEYQDIDAVQYALVRRLVPPDGNLCAIGDPDQSIYRFRGADVGFFLRFQEDFPGARVVHLGRNYRSNPALVEAAGQAIRPASLVPGRRLEAVRREAPERVVVQEAASGRAEAELVVHTLERLLGGTSYFSLDSGRVDGVEGRQLSFADFAVLYRTGAQAAPLAEALGRAGIPFQKRSHHRLADHAGVRKLLAAAAGETPGGSVEARLLRAVERLSGEAGVAELAEAAELLRPLAVACGDDPERLLAEVALGEEVDLWDPRAERVSLLTLHAAKGLEFPVVFLVGCEDGLLPLSWPGVEEGRDAAARAEELAQKLAEERRLFFVGMTRAERLLVITHARRRRIRGEVQQRRPSPFLEAIAAALLDRRREEEAAAERPEAGAVQLRLL
jgi:uncharacterized protein (TIGR00375 family)